VKVITTAVEESDEDENAPEEPKAATKDQKKDEAKPPGK
jgi:hypothetical protein